MESIKHIGQNMVGRRCLKVIKQSLRNRGGGGGGVNSSFRRIGENFTVPYQYRYEINQIDSKITRFSL